MRIAAITGLLVAALPLSVQAQGNITLSLLRIETPDGDIDQQDFNGFNQAHCDDAANTIMVLDTNVSGTPILELWRGGSSSDCNLAERRTGDQQECFDLGVPTTVDDTDGSIEVALVDLDVDEICDRRSTFSLFVFDTDGAPSGDVIEDEYGSIEFLVDDVAPDAPPIDSDDTSLSSGSSLNVTWSEPSDNDALEYRVFVVNSVGVCGLNLAPNTEGLADIDDDLTISGYSVFRTEQNQNSQSINLDTQLGLEIGQSTAAFVVAVDMVGNLGDPSEEICLSRVETFGFCDAWNADVAGGADGEPCQVDCHVSAPGTARNNHLLLILAGFGLIASIGIRRRRS